MDRIRNLSLDQKAKLYYMALLQKGMIDRLPDDPKAAYVRDMMGKMDTIQKISPKVDRSSLEKLSGMDEADRTFKGETDEKRLDDLLNIIFKYVKDPDDAEEELANYRERGYPGFSDMLKANLDRDLDFYTWVQVGHDKETFRRERGLEEMAKELGYLKETTISRGIEVEVMEDSIMINGSRLKELDIAYIEQAPNRIYRGYLHTDKGQVNLDGGEEGLNEFLRAAGAPVDEREYPHNIVEEYFMKYGVEVTTSEFDVS